MCGDSLVNLLKLFDQGESDPDLDIGLHVLRVRHHRGVCHHLAVSESRDPKDVRDAKKNPDSGPLPKTHEERYGRHH